MIKPIRNNIVFKPFFTDGFTEGGIMLPFKTESDKGEIVAVGNGTTTRSMKRKVGEIVMRVHIWGEPFELNGETYYLMDESAIIALV